jgi:transposase
MTRTSTAVIAVRACQSASTFDPSLECAPDGGHLAGLELTGTAGLSEDESHGQAPLLQHRIQTADCPGIPRRRDTPRSRDISRNLIRIWVKKLETGAFDEDARAADLLQEYEAKIAALERMVGRQALEIEFLKGEPDCTRIVGGVIDADLRDAHTHPQRAGCRHGRQSALHFFSQWRSR